MGDLDIPKPACVLLVEDNEDDIELTLEALKESKVKMDIHVVTDGQAAMQFLRNENGYNKSPRPDLVLLDLNLPKMDGREVLKEVRQDPELTDIPIVVLTTSQNEEDVLKAYRLHANCYISKPVDFKRFSEIVRQIEGFWLQLVKLPKGGGSGT